MLRIDKRRLLLCFPLLASVGAGQVVVAQPPTQPSTQTPAPAPPQTVSVPAPVPATPEDLGDSLMAQQRYQAAIEAYKKGPRDSAVLQNKLGIAYQMMFNVNEALRCYQASLKLDPGNAQVMNNLGTVFDTQKLYGAAEKMYRKSLKIEPKSAITEKNLGTALMAQHKYKKGVEAYQIALALDPAIFENKNSPKIDNPSSTKDRGAMNYYMAKSCVRAGMNARAIDYLRLALNEGYTNPTKIIADLEFASLRGIPAFEELIAAQRTP
jgi:tetratricopeptide (TPR) repeat protein